MRRAQAQMDITSPGTVIDRLWFGHNLEHTRRVMWGGLAAELLKGRKFTGTRSPGGMAEPWHPVGPPSTLFLVERQFRRPGVAEALFTAAMLNMFCRRAAGLAMTMGAYFEPVNEGAILVERDGARLTPAGQVFSLFRAHWGGRTVPADMRPRGNLDVAASQDEAGRLTLTVINPEPESSAAFEAQVRGTAELVDGSARALVGDSHLPGSEFASLRTEVRLSGSTLACEAPALSVMLLQAACVPD